MTTNVVKGSRLRKYNNCNALYDGSVVWRPRKKPNVMCCDIVTLSRSGAQWELKFSLLNQSNIWGKSLHTCEPTGFPTLHSFFYSFFYFLFMSAGLKLVHLFRFWHSVKLQRISSTCCKKNGIPTFPPDLFIPKSPQHHITPLFIYTRPPGALHTAVSLHTLTSLPVRGAMI